MKDMYCEELALEEMRRSFSEYKKAADVLDQKVNTLLNTASLVIGLFGLLNIRLLENGQPAYYWVGFIVVVLLYLSMIALCTNALQPAEYMNPIKADWDVVHDNILILSPKEAVLKMISGYIEYIPHNKRVNEIKAKKVRISTWLFGIIVVLLFTLSLSVR